MNLDLIIAALRTYVTAFDGRVMGAARLNAALDEGGSAVLPCAYVMPMSDSVDTIDNLGDVLAITDRFSVVVAMDASADGRGQAAVENVYSMRAALWKALLGWEPDDETGPLNYEGGEAFRLDRARLFYRYDFSAVSTCKVDSRQQTILDSLPDLTVVDVKVDMVDPAADPNTPPVTDESQGGYAGGYPGPDGRIEHEMEITLPTS